MAQNSADLTRLPEVSIDSEGSQPDVLEIQVIEETAGSPPTLMSIDTLLALTDEGWDIDDQVRTLKDAAEQRPYPRSEKPPPPLPRERPARKTTSIPPPLPSSASKLAPPARKGPPPLPRATSETPLQEAKASVPFANRSLVDLLSDRVRALEEGSDRIALARAQMELAIAHEMFGDEDGRCVAFAEAALKVDPDLAGAHALLRRRKHARGGLMAMLSHLDH